MPTFLSSPVIHMKFFLGFSSLTLHTFTTPISLKLDDDNVLL